MRTRFLPADCFNSPTETLEFLHCSPPHLPPSYTSIHQHLQRCFDDISPLSVSLEIEKLPIGTSLNKFLSNVLPQLINAAEIGDSTDDLSFTGTACSRELRSFCADFMVEVDASQEKDDIASDIKGTNNLNIFQFEIPEKYDLQPQKENVKIFSDIPQLASNVDMPNLELRMQDFFEIHQAVYSVDDVSREYFMEQKADLLEDSGSTRGQLGSCVQKFPVFEIDEASLGIFNDIAMKNELIIFKNIESQKWIQEDEIASNDKVHLDFKEFDLLVYLSNHCSVMHHPEIGVGCSNFLEEIDFVIDKEDPDVGHMLLSHHKTSQDISNFSRNLVLFEEFQFTDIDLYNFIEVFYCLAIKRTAEECDLMFSEAMKFKNFDDLIACNDLILVDDAFRSLPVPILLDCQKPVSVVSVVEKVFSALEPESASTFDCLYLDWHFFEEDYWNSSRYSSCWKAFEEIDTYSIDFTLDSIDNRMLQLDCVLSGGIIDEPNLGENKEILQINLHGISLPPISHEEVASQTQLNEDDRKGVTREIQSKKGAAHVNVNVETTTEFNEMDFLLNSHHECGGGRKKCKPHENSIFKDTVLPVVHSGDSLPARGVNQAPLQKWDIKMLQVELSNEILSLIDNFQKSFLGILLSDAELIKDLYPYQDLDDISFLRVRKEEIMDRIKKISAPGIPSLANENFMSLVALSAIKQMAWYLCYYGLHAAQLYIHNLSTNLQGLKSRFSFLQNLIQNMCEKAEKEITKFHPSLSVVQQVLESSLSENGLKVLIVAEPVYWWPLKRFLTSMKISYNESQNIWTNTCKQDKINDFADPTSMISQADCCLVSYEYFSASFPYDKFGVILEYGGSRESSRVSSISSKLDRGPCLYFLKVKLEESAIPKAICYGVDMPKSRGSTMASHLHVNLVLNESNNKMEDLLNFVPLEENHNKVPVEAVVGGQECYLKPLHSASLAMESKEIPTNAPSFPDIVVVNTKNFDKEMVISRRSTYQKILALEKEGAQVVERDLNLPVDVVLDAANCLAWYDLKNIRKKSSAPDEAFSCLSLYVENIAASILTSLSYAFSSCILVFEGERHFLAGVMESSDKLYAAAASLGIDLQIFCSYSSVMTDEIILSCIEAVIKLTRGLYPKMPDSESLAESFLTAFPSINPLSAHAILTSGSSLIDFLEWSHDCRIHAVQKHKIPHESVALLGLLCQYGEREDSKSGMTDSSSSVSYVPGRIQPGSNSETKKRKCTDDHPKFNIYENELCHFESPTLFPDVRLSPPRASAPRNIWMSENSEIIDECGKPGLTFDDKFFCERKKVEANMMRNYAFGMTEGPPKLEESQKPKYLQHNTNFGVEEILHMAARNRSHRLGKEKSGNQQEDLKGEVIDTNLAAMLRKEIPELNSLSFSPHDVNKDWATGMSRTTRKLSFGSSGLANFPTSAEIDSDLDVWICQSTNEYNSMRKNKNAPDYCSDIHKFSPMHQKGLLHDSMQQKTAIDSYNQRMQEKDSAHCGGTPLWDAIHSGQTPLRESPWTVEFLNRIKEKSRTRQQSLPPGISPPPLGSSTNKSNASKRKSPSILEYYKYQNIGGSKKSIEQRRQKQLVKPSSLPKNEKASHSILPAWTPVDKRAKRTLSFTTIGKGGQSKLTWSDKNSSTLSRKIMQQL
ncbi:protein SHORTAGE IN CHIASMATA 1 [Coffea arabica]|uniref:Protein SHORTAGE IN CHIASMATA 1 n=1 Tax=Coffea arabica TaxID=13443 RepID=A0ABM4WCI3_COFAR